MEGTTDFDDATENNVDIPVPDPRRIGITGFTECLGISRKGSVAYASVVVSKTNIIEITIILVILLIIFLFFLCILNNQNR
jgi:hypothetical protein